MNLDLKFYKSMFSSHLFEQVIQSLQYSIMFVNTEICWVKYAGYDAY